MIKALRIRREAQKDNELKELLKANSEDIKKIVGSIENLVEEIRKDRESRYGKSPTDM